MRWDEKKRKNERSANSSLEDEAKLSEVLQEGRLVGTREG